MKDFIKQLIPPIAKTLSEYSLKYGWKGNYGSFSEAQQKSNGYDAAPILERIIYTTQLFKKGEIAYERDGIIYDKPHYHFPVLSSLLWIAGQNNQQLTVLDFGGSLGTTYLQMRPYLQHIQKLQWCIVEQAHFVEKGKQHFEDDILKFYPTVEACMQEQQPHVLLICGVLQYLPEPYVFLTNVAQHKIPYLLLDYIGYHLGEDYDRITIQNVPPDFYGVEASYACWFFNKTKLYQHLQQYYDLQYDFLDDYDTYYLELERFKYEGMLWKAK